MEATGILRDEHSVMETVLAALEHMARQLGTDHSLSRDRAERALEILERYADGCHQRKEEQHLFAALEARGAVCEGGSIASLVREHEQARRHLQGMARTLVGASENDPQAGPAFARHARAYVGLLRQHIRKENEIVYVEAEQRLSAADDAGLAAEFARIDRDQVGESVLDRYMRWARDLGDRGE